MFPLALSAALLREIKRTEKKSDQKISTGKELMDAWNERELLRDKVSAAKWYRENTNSGFGVPALSVKFPELARGWRNVLRIISGYLWAVPRLVRAKLVETQDAGCIFCGDLQGDTEDHMLLHCKAWTTERELAEELAGTRANGDSYKVALGRANEKERKTWSTGLGSSPAGEDRS
ncbi:MAG: uncharacterized protein A8A55_2129 [Amphiamblys sp. WSBS2006]|nr:MAG: uncharacterized protein A8A55_2129 [Amphiamblys sp. WSBS2006]